MIHHIEVTVSESDLDELREGRLFNWKFQSKDDPNVYVEVELLVREEEDDAVLDEPPLEEDGFNPFENIIGMDESLNPENSDY